MAVYCTVEKPLLNVLPDQSHYLVVAKELGQKRGETEEKETPRPQAGSAEETEWRLVESVQDDSDSLDSLDDILLPAYVCANNNQSNCRDPQTDS